MTKFYKKLSIIIPVYNEKRTIKNILFKINKLTKIKKEIIVVDDASSDGTLEIIKKNKKLITKLIIHKNNKGKGGAIKSARKYITGDIVVIQDADLEYDPKDYQKLLNCFKTSIKVVYGSRVLGQKRYFSKNFSSFMRIFYNHVLTILSNILNNQNLTDAHTCYKMFRSNTFLKIKLEEQDFSFCPEITTKLGNEKIKIMEVPISYKGRDYASGKKIKLIDGIKAIITLFKYRFFK